MFGDFAKSVLEWMLQHWGFTIVLILFLLSCLFKLTKREIDPLGAVIGWIGRHLTKDVRKDVETLKTDLDAFEKKTTKEIGDIKAGTTKNCTDLKERMDEMEAAQQKSNDMQTVSTIRAHVLDFANSCYNKRKHTKLEFDNIINENTQYQKLVMKYGLENDVYKEDFDFIMKVYHKCRDEGTFLKEGD